MVIVQSLWVGDKLSQMEQYSIKSFLNTGHEYHLYTYNKIKGIPKGVKIKSGNKIMPKKDIFKMQDTFLPFSDIFRYKLLYEKGNYWVDLDMICLKKLDFKEPFIFSSERTIQKGAYKMVVKFVPNIGVLKAPPKSEFYRELFEKCMEYHKKSKSKEKITYMRLLREMIDEYKYKKYVKPPKYFCNLDWWDAKHAFCETTEFRNKYGVKAKTLKNMFHGPYTVHFWRNLATNKYKLDIDGEFEDGTLWELMKDIVDGKRIPKLTKNKTKKRTKNWSKKRINGNLNNGCKR